MQITHCFTGLNVSLSLAMLSVGVAWAAPANEDLPGVVQRRGFETKARDEKVRVLMIGDSTVSSYTADKPTRGWGQLLPEFFNDQVSFLNAAASGRSSKSYRDEGRWDEAMAYKPQFVFIQFGHNDQPGKGAYRETDPATTYRDNLRGYIADARAAKAQPILVTSVARRTFNADGRIKSTLGPWVEAAKAVGAEEGVPVIDLHALSIEAFEKIGKGNDGDLSNKPGDPTHFSEKGARLVAGLVAGGVRDKVPDLAVFLKKE